MDAGIAYIPEDRGRDAAFPDLSVRENISVTALPRLRAAVASAARPRRTTPAS